MSFSSPAIRTSHALLGPGTTFTDRGEYVRIESASQPNFYFGTLLAFRAPPREDDGERWRALHRAEFGASPHVRHETYVWEGGDPHPEALASFQAAGFDYQSDEILGCENVQPPVHGAEGVRVRSLAGDSDWEQVRTLEAFDSPPGVNLDSFRKFLAERTRSRRALVEAGQGKWFGAFLDDGRLVGNLGLFVVGDLARYQAVSTHADFRRRGIAATLVHAAAEDLARTRPPALFLMVADPAGPAIGLYRLLGFRTIGRTWAMFKGPDTSS